MLPSTGYFKALSCPFYDSGLCERPYCHFRHVKKETPCVSNEDIESGAILQQLVSEAVKKVLQQSEGSNVPQSSQDAVLEGSTKRSEVSHASSQQKVTYNPTPISELKRIITDDIENNEDNNEQRKRHIPVPYTPRKPATVPIKRPDESNGECQPFIYTPPSVKYLPGSNESPKLDPYTPKGFTESTETYLPGVEKEIQEYKPVETQCSSKRNYIPSDTNVVKKKVLEYKPAKVSTKAASAVTYEPTPRSQVPCFSSEEDEPETKKRKLSPCLIGLDDLGPEFDLLGEILDEEKSKDNLPTFIDVLKIVKEPKKLGIKSISESKRSDSKEKNKKEKFLEVKDKEDKKSKTTSSDKKSSHKRSSKEKDRDKDRNKEREKYKEKHKEKGNDKDKDRYKKKEKELSCTKDNNKRSKSSEKSKRTEINSSKHSIKIKKDSGRSKEDKVYLSSSSSSSKNDSKMKDKSLQSNKTHKHSKEKHRSKENEEKSKLETIKNVVLNESYDDDHHFDDNFANDLDEEASESDEENIALECKRIFEEYIPTEKPQTQEETTHQDGNIDSEYIPSKKRISHTLEKNIKVVPKLPIKPDYKVSAAQKMAERLAKVREYHASKAALENNHNKSEPAKTTPTSSVNSKIRIAHVPYASTLLSAKKTISIKPSSSKMEPPASTITQTVKKGSLRVAHIPNENFIDRPGVLEPLASKIPANIRSTYLNMMIDECLKMYLTASDAYARAQHEELNTSKKCSTIPIYKNSAVLTVSRLRKEILECNGVKKSGSESTSGNNGKTGSVSPGSSWSILNRHNRDVDNSVELRGARLYNNIKKWVLTEEQLQENGFPRPHPSETRGRAIIHVQDKKQKPPKGFIRTCCRCQRDYTVDKRGLATTKEECIYHPNRKYRFRGDVKYQCCSQDGSADGCCVAPSHVYEYVDYDNLKGFVTTMPPEREMADYGVYALDCEMCYTTQGLDLTRITVINSSCKVVYETLIKPLHPIIDYNTRYSGITEEQMTDVKTTLLDVQATLLTMFNSKTILIGHSLESDCKALKLIHDTVIDTSVLFPHKMGPPYKRALRNLSSEYIRKIIQNSVDGHDSAEDATVCMELIIYKLKEDLKSR